MSSLINKLINKFLQRMIGMDISKRVKNLVRMYNTHDPIRIAKLKGIEVEYYDLGEIKGFYKKILGNKFIGLNDTIGEFSILVSSGHELGHDVLHSTKQIQLMKDYVLLPKDNVIEIQANKFVAELLLYEGANYEYILKSGTELDKKILKMLIDLKNTNIS